MRQVTRRQLLKGGVGGVAAVGALAAIPALAYAKRPEDGIAIHAHGVVTRPDGFNLAISLDVAGRADSLAGSGWDSGAAASSPTMVPTNVVGACIYTAFGSLDDDVVTLDGKSLFTNRPLTASPEETTPRSDTRADGRAFHGEVNLNTGDILWTLAPGDATNLFSGKGVVVLVDRD